MNHDEAVQLMGTEKYLLNELSPELREEFEAHFFECAECANDVRAGAVFVEQSKAVFASEAPVPWVEPAPAPYAPRSWWAWLRPAIAVPVFAALLAVIVYQNWPARRSPEVLQAAYVNIGSRGATVPAVSAYQGQRFLLRVSVPPDQIYGSYFAEIYAPDGKMRWSVKLPSSAGNDSYFIEVPASSYVEGVYAIAIRGVGPDGNSSEVGRGSFELRILK